VEHTQPAPDLRPASHSLQKEGIAEARAANEKRPNESSKCTPGCSCSSACAALHDEWSVPRFLSTCQEGLGVTVPEFDEHDILLWTPRWVLVGLKMPRMTPMEQSLNTLGRTAPRGTVRAFVDGALDDLLLRSRPRETYCILRPNQMRRSVRPTSYIDLKIRRWR
jgi:hypothetical protein